MTEDRKAYILKRIMDELEKQFNEEDFQEGIHLAVSGTIFRTKDAPSNKVSVEDLQVHAAKGEYKTFGWSNNTKSWPDEMERLMAIDISKQTGESEGDGTMVMVSKKRV